MLRIVPACFALLLASCTLDFDDIQNGGDSGSTPREAGAQHPAGGAGSDARAGDTGMDSGTRDSGMKPGSVTQMDANVRAEGGTSGHGGHAGMDAGAQPDTGDAATDTDAAVDMPLACTTIRASGSGSMIASVDTSSASDALQGSCGGTGSPDRIVDWRVPQTDFWVLDTKGSAFDTVLYANGDQCTGDELACNNNLSSLSSASEIVARFEAGQHVAVVIDGNAGSKGAAVLNAARVSCPNVDLDESALPSTFVDEGGDQTESFRFTAPANGFYSFRAQTGTEVTLDLLSGPRCGGDLIGANTGSGLYGAEVIRTLSAGQVVTLTVLPADATASSFTLDITQPSGLMCPTEDLFDHLNADEALPADAPHLLTASCAPPAEADQTVAGFGAVAFHVNVDIQGTTQYGISVKSGFQSAVYMLKGDCGGTEYSCTVGSYNSSSMRYEAFAGIKSSPDPQDFVLVVQNIDQNTGGPIDLKYQIQVAVVQ